MLKSWVGYMLLISIAAVLLWYMGLDDLLLLGEKQIPVYEVSQQDTNSTQLADVENSSARQLANDSSALSLALENIDLQQGEGGIDLWRLQARWANIRQEDGIILIDRPELKYFIEEGKNDTFLFVTSSSGEIDQANHLLRFVSNVVSKYQESIITGNLLIYDGMKREMWYPADAHFTGTGISGYAKSVKWLLDSRTIEAEGDVNVTFSRSLAGKSK